MVMDCMIALLNVGIIDSPFYSYTLYTLKDILSVILSNLNCFTRKMCVISCFILPVVKKAACHFSSSKLFCVDFAYYKIRC